MCDKTSLNSSQNENCVQTKVAEKTKTHILRSITLFFEYRAVYEIMWGKYGTVRQAADDITRRMRFVYWIPKVHSECVILIAFPLQQWLHERASVLHYTYTVCPVSCFLRTAHGQPTTAPQACSSTVCHKANTAPSSVPRTLYVFT